MSSVVIAGNTSGSVTLAAPDVAGTTTLTLPSTSGNVITSANISSNLPAGSILQVVYASSGTLFSTTSQTLQDTGFSATITPSSSSSKILIISNNNMYVGQNAQGASYVFGRVSLARNTTQLQEARLATNTGGSITDIVQTSPITYLDSPSTTSAVTYRIYIASINFSFSTIFNNTAPSSMTLIEVKG